MSSRLGDALGDAVQAKLQLLGPRIVSQLKSVDGEISLEVEPELQSSALPGAIDAPQGPPGSTGQAFMSGVSQAYQQFQRATFGSNSGYSQFQQMTQNVNRVIEAGRIFDNGAPTLENQSKSKRAEIQSEAEQKAREFVMNRISQILR